MYRNTTCPGANVMKLCVSVLQKNEHYKFIKMEETIWKYIQNDKKQKYGFGFSWYMLKNLDLIGVNQNDLGLSPGPA